MHRRFVSAALATGLIVSMALAACNPTPSSPATQSTPPPIEQTTPTAAGRSVTIEAVQGKVEFKRAGASDFGSAAANQVLSPGDEVRTGANGRVVLLLDDGTRMVVAANSSLVLEQLSGTTQTPVSRFFLNLGEVFAVHKGELPEGASYQIETPSGVATIRGSYVGVVFFGGSNSGTVMCLAGHCEYAPSGPGQPVALAGKQGLRFDQGGGQGSAFELTAIHARLWSDALDTLEETGAGGVQELDVQCVCDTVTPTTLTCDDGTIYEEFPSCLPPEEDTGQVCSCDGSALVCDDGTIYQDDADCADSGGEDFCTCDGATSYCLDGSMTEDDPSCSVENACQCEGATLVCGVDRYENDPTCEDQQAACQEVSCGDGWCDVACGEDVSSCQVDCGEETPEPETPEPVCEQTVCGDGMCSADCGEDADTCSEDCGAPTDEPTEIPDPETPVPEQ